MGTPPTELPSASPSTQVVGQQSHPSTVVPMGGSPIQTSTVVGGRRINTLAVVSLVTALVAPFGHVTGIGGLALIGLIVSYVHVAVSALVIIFFFGVVMAILAAILHGVATSGG